MCVPPVWHSWRHGQETRYLVFAILWALGWQIMSISVPTGNGGTVSGTLQPEEERVFLPTCGAKV